MAYIPKIKVVDGKIHGARRLSKPPKNGKCDGRTAFVRCIRFIENNHNHHDLEKFLQFQHDAWNTCDADGNHPLYHAVSARQHFQDGVDRNRGKDEGSSLIQWYANYVVLFDKVISRICQHLDISDLDDNQVVRLVGLLTAHSDQPWADVARKRMVAQGLGVTWFPTHNDVDSSIPMLVARIQRYSGDLASIKPWLDLGVAHEPPNRPRGYGLMMALREIESAPASNLWAMRSQIADIARVMSENIPGPAVSHELARQVGRRQSDEMLQVGIHLTRQCTHVAIGLLDGIANAMPGADSQFHERAYMAALEGITSPVETEDMIRMLACGAKFLSGEDIKAVIDTMQENYGAPAVVDEQTAMRLGRLAVDSLLTPKAMLGQALDIKHLLEQAGRLVHPDNTHHMDLAIIGRLLDHSLWYQSTSITRALVSFLEEKPRVRGQQADIDAMLGSWDKPTVNGSPPDSYLVHELIQALVKSGWTPSGTLAAAILGMVNNGVRCARPIIDMHMDNLKENGSIDPKDLGRLFGACMAEPGEIKDGSGYAGMYAWDREDCWPAKQRVMDALLEMCRGHDTVNDAVRGCDEALRVILNMSVSPSDQAISMAKRLIQGCGWSYEKSVDIVPEDGDHWLGPDCQEVLDGYMAVLSHDGLDASVGQAAPARKRPRF